jgi:hypothetical protein
VSNPSVDNESLAASPYFRSPRRQEPLHFGPKMSPEAWQLLENDSRRKRDAQRAGIARARASARRKQS